LTGRSLGASLTVNDLQRSLTWYRDIMGFTVDRQHERDGKLMAISLRAGEVRILITQDDGSRGWDRAKGEGFSLMITTDQNVDEIAARIKEAGAALDSEPADMPWGARMFRLRDPDGFKYVVSADRGQS
jgi:uncharacterized glyoxalase superfamily protein PhnB